MDGTVQDPSDDEHVAPRCEHTTNPVGLIGVWVADRLVCIDVAELPPIEHDGGEGCEACCPPARR